MQLYAAQHAPRAPPVRASSAPAPPAPFALFVREARDSADFRAAAGLRAFSFYTYPSGRSDFAQASHQRMKADAEWAALSEKTAGTDPVWACCQVTCLLALADEASGQLLQHAPVPGVSWRVPDGAVCGTLDLNRGPQLPSEQLRGREGAGEGERAYISNVAVLPAARRRGVARELIAEAQRRAAQAGVRALYVHVAADNESARALYASAGFEVEAEEKAESPGQPPHLLLLRRL
jgi:ribosomal protein S18 acetylase RimI-like enzyme